MPSRRRSDFKVFTFADISVKVDIFSKCLRAYALLSGLPHVIYICIIIIIRKKGKCMISLYPNLWI